MLSRQVYCCIVLLGCCCSSGSDPSRKDGATTATQSGAPPGLPQVLRSYGCSYMEVARAALPASLALVAHSYGPLFHEWRICPDNSIPPYTRRCRQVSVVNVDAPLTQHASTPLLRKLFTWVNTTFWRC